jgi:hypothetical protein
VTNLELVPGEYDGLPVEYVLRAKSLHATRPPGPDPAYRLLGFDLTARRRGKGLGGNNIQAVIGAPSVERYRLDQDVALWLPSGWWVSLRNQFAAAPDVASAIVGSVADELGAMTSRATDSEGAEAEAVTRELFETEFRATGPDTRHDLKVFRHSVHIPPKQRREAPSPTLFPQVPRAVEVRVRVLPEPRRLTSWAVDETCLVAEAARRDVKAHGLTDALDVLRSVEAKSLVRDGCLARGEHLRCEVVHGRAT